MPTQASLQLLNCTNNGLNGVVEHQYQMNIWSFGPIANMNYKIYPVKFYSGSYDEDDSAEATFSMNGEDIFSLQARSDNSSAHFLQVQVLVTVPGMVLALAANDNVTGAQDPTSIKWIPLNSNQETVQLGYIESDSQNMGLAVIDLSVLFGDAATVAVYMQAITDDNLNYQQAQTLLSNVQSHFSPSVTEGGSWMGQLSAVIGKQVLSKICLPGTHDSGMSQISNATFGARAANAQTQTLTIGQQLLQGIRYIDCRPVIWNGEQYLGHFSYSSALGWVGATGERWQNVLNDITSFLAQPGRSKELILLDFSHGFNYDNPANKGGYGFSKTDSIAWLNSVAAALGNVLYKNAAVSPDTAVLNDMLNTGAQVIARFDGSFSDGLASSNGFWTDEQMVINGGYSDTGDLHFMVSDQLQKLTENSHDTSALFLTSWTLTQTTEEAVLGIPSLETMAGKANPVLYPNIENYIANNRINPETYPNLMITDYADDSVTRILELAVQINTLLSNVAASQLI